MNFKYYADVYLKIKKAEVKPSTYRRYENITRNFILPYFADRNISEIKVSELRLWLLNFENKANKTRVHFISVLSGIFQEAFYDEVIQRNPTKFLKKPRVLRSDIKPFTNDEIDLILSNAKNYNFKMYLYIAFYTGMRSGEILALKKEDIDFEKRLIHVKRSRSRFGESTPKTHYSIRVVPILDDLFPHLVELYQQRDDYLLISAKKKPYRDSNSFLVKHWIPLLKKLNIPYRRMYNTRHTFATMMLSKGYTTPHNLARILGHCDSSMVHRVYARFLDHDRFDFDFSIKIYN